jgi:hypothetical protein
VLFAVPALCRYVGIGPRDSSSESSSLLRQHILQPPSLLLFVKWKLLYAALLFISWILIGNNLNMLCENVNKTF